MPKPPARLFGGTISADGFALAISQGQELRTYEGKVAVLVVFAGGLPEDDNEVADLALQFGRAVSAMTIGRPEPATKVRPI